MMHISHYSVLRRPLVLATILAGALLILTTLAAAPLRARNATLPECTRASIGGEITWSSACAVTTPLTITDGLTLTIEPGVEVQFSAAAGLRIEGALKANGRQARQIRLVGASGSWPGISVVQPDGDVHLKSVTIANAAAGLAISQQAAGLARAAARVEVIDSMFYSNTIAIDADYSVITGAPDLRLRSSLLTGNGIGLRFTSVPSGNVKLKFTHNSFVANGLGVQVIGGGKLKLKRQWWGSQDGPELSCASLPVPRTDTRDRVCGLALADVRPWSEAPNSRVFLPTGAQATVESGLGQDLVTDDLQETSLLTLTVPTGTFSEPVDLLVAGRTITETPGVAQPGLQPTSLSFEITAAAGGREIHEFAGEEPLRVEISYRLEDLNGVDPTKLTLYYYDETRGIWSFAGIRTIADPANRRIIAYLSHLSRYRTMGAELNSVMLPLIVR
jgi:hypothetical protein